MIYVCVSVCEYTNSNAKTFKMPKRYKIKEQVIETIQKIYDYWIEKYKKKKKVHELIEQ